MGDILRVDMNEAAKRDGLVRVQEVHPHPFKK
jgi:hypothetical protein